MKKVTVILSMFVFAITSQSFAQNAARPEAIKTKPAEPKPGETGYKYKMTDALISSAQPKPAAKPTPSTKIAKPAPGTKADIYIKIEDIKGESKD